MELVWCLVEPRTPENVGAAARAIKTMGFHSLRMVNPCDYQTGPARWLAHGSNDVLDSARTYANFDEMLADCDFIVGSTAKIRHGHHSALPPSGLQVLLADKSESLQRCAMVFGREDTGLHNDEIARCHVLSSVPLAAPYPSINLAQAVMIYAYALSDLSLPSRHEMPLLNGELSALQKKLALCLEHYDIDSEDTLSLWLKERTPLLTARDVRLLHKLLGKILPVC